MKTFDAPHTPNFDVGDADFSGVDWDNEKQLFDVLDGTNTSPQFVIDPDQRARYVEYLKNK